MLNLGDASVNVRFMISDCAWGIFLIDAVSVCVTASFSLRFEFITGESSLGYRDYELVHWGEEDARHVCWAMACVLSLRP